MTDFLKDYHIINNLPYGFDFYNQNAKQLRAHKEWFFENKEQRLAERQKAYHAFCGKYLDYTPESLKGLGEFFLQAIETEKLTQEEYAAERAKYPPEIPIDDYKLTLRSLSIIVDTGIYFGELMIHNHKNMEWEQKITRNKNDGERGYMVIKINPHIFRSTMNPIVIIRTNAFDVADNTFVQDGLYSIYKHYCEDDAPEFMPDSVS